MKTRTFGAVLAAITASCVSPSSRAAEVTLKTATALQINTVFGKLFTDFVDHVNKTGKGLVHLNVVGGPEAVPPFELGNAVKTGVVDLANIPANYYAKLLPISNATGLETVSPEQQRHNGAYALISKLVREKVNAHYLANYGYGISFHLYLRKKINKPDLSGLKIRVPPGLSEFIAALGGSTMQTPPGEIYTALQRGVIDGYVWPLWGILDLGWQTATKYRVEPGWRTVSIHILVNQDRWNKLSPEQRNFLDNAGIWFEKHTEKLIEARNAEEKKKQASSGIRTITFVGADAKKYVGAAYNAGWKMLLKRDPKHAAQLRKLLSAK